MTILSIVLLIFGEVMRQWDLDRAQGPKQVLIVRLLWDMGGHFKREKNKLQKSHYGTIVILSDFLGH